MLILLTFGFAAITRLKMSLETKINGVELSLAKLIDEKIDSKLEAFHVKLKQNDFAHLNNTIEALTFTLEKNKFLSVEDKA
jgi:ribosomal protein S13